MAKHAYTIDDAARELIQLEASDAKAARRLADRVRRLAGGSIGEVRTHLEAAAKELSCASRTRDPERARARLASAGNAVERAMAAHDASEPGPSAHDAAPSMSTWTGAVDPLMLAALSALEPADGALDIEPAMLSQPEAADTELLDGFIAESEEYLRDAEAALLALERQPTDSESINRVFRCFHTIKGTSAFLGLEAITDLAHRAESLLSRARAGSLLLTGPNADLALQAVDHLGALVRAVRVESDPPDAATLLAALAAADSAASSAPVEVRAAPTSTPAASADGEAGGESYTRVRTDRLDQMLDIIGEMVIAHTMIAEDALVTGGTDDGLTRKVSHAGKIVRELQELSISMRMVPMRAMFQKLARVCRDAARKRGKLIDFVADGEDTEIDRNMVDVVSDPLVHMVRNAVDHGIESAQERGAAGKPARGTVRLAAFHAGGSVVITLEDDGRGLDRNRLAAKAVSMGLVDADQTLTDREVHELIFAPGFSTAESVTDLSGRGVGMDVVRRNIEALRGRIDIASEPGRGTRFGIRLPLTLAITDGMLVRVGAERYIVPTVNIQMSFRPERSALSTVVGRGEVVSLRGEVLPIVRLHETLNVTGAVTDPTLGLLVIVGSAERRCALLVDELLGQHQVVAKTLGAGIGKVNGVSGGAILGDGRVGLILDVPELIAPPKSTAKQARGAA